MRIGKTREKLALMIEELLGADFICLPEDIYVNRGSNKYNDWCSWTATAYNRNDKRYIVQLCSWDTMKELVSVGKLQVVGSKIGVGSNEVTSSK